MMGESSSLCATEVHMPSALLTGTCLGYARMACPLDIVRTCSFYQLLQLQKVLSSLLDACSYATGTLAEFRALLDICMRLHSGWGRMPKACRM